MLLLNYLSRLWSWMGSVSAAKSTMPVFEFVPTPAFHAFVGQEARFVVSNLLDLVLQHQGLMTDMLVVEIHRPGALVSTVWFRYSTDALSTSGSAWCTLFAGDDDRIFDGVCGQLRDRKRM